MIWKGEVEFLVMSEYELEAYTTRVVVKMKMVIAKVERATAKVGKLTAKVVMEVKARIPVWRRVQSSTVWRGTLQGSQ